MAQYKFRLQKVLDIRKDIEEQCKRKFQEVQSQRKSIEDKLNNMKENYKKYNSVKCSGTIIEQKIAHQYLMALNYSIDSASNELKNKELAVNKVREELKQRQIDRKTVEKLKEKEKAKFVKEQSLIEQKSNDEFALYGFIRKLERR